MFPHGWLFPGRSCTDPISSRQLRRAVQEAAEVAGSRKRVGLTAVCVTHDQEEALAVSDRIVVMDRGRIAQVGTPSDLYERRPLPSSRTSSEMPT